MHSSQSAKSLVNKFPFTHQTSTRNNFYLMISSLNNVEVIYTLHLPFPPHIPLSFDDFLINDRRV